MHPYMSPPPFPVCVPLPVCDLRISYRRRKSLLPLETQPFYLGSLKRTRQIYVRNPVGCLIQEAEGISRGITG